MINTKNANVELVCKRLKDFLYNGGITNKSLSILCAVSEKTISKWLNGDLIQTNALIVIKQKYPDFNIEYILTGNHQKEINVDMLKKIIKSIPAKSLDIDQEKLSIAIASIYGILNSNGANNKDILINEKAIKLYLENL